MKKNTLITIIILSVFALSAQVVFAQDSGANLTNSNSDTQNASGNTQNATNPTQNATNPTGGAPIVASLPNPLGDRINSVPEFFYAIVKVLVDISYVVVAFFLILSGFKFVAARGNEEKLKSAKTTFFYTIIGALIVIGAQTIITVVKGIVTGI